jgi:hypothetical protein
MIVVRCFLCYPFADACCCSLHYNANTDDAKGITCIPLRGNYEHEKNTTSPLESTVYI